MLPLWGSGGFKSTTMWKDFFYFSKSQRVGIVVLLGMILILIFLNLFMPVFFPSPEPVETNFLKEVDFFKQSLVSRDSLRKAEWKAKYQKLYEDKYLNDYPKIKENTVLFRFNPNKTDSASFVKLGLTPKVASNILKYRNKGGHFNTKESFSKVYGISVTKFKNLEPYIVIEQEAGLNADTVRSIKPEIKADVYVELNSADTTELMKVKGIGRGYAKGIVRYRKSLGGFNSVDQLKEIYGMTPENFDKIQKFCTVNKDLIQKINVNIASAERLNAHPYLDFYQSKAIYELRRNKGKLKSVTDFKNISEFNTENIIKIQTYLSFE